LGKIADDAEKMAAPLSGKNELAKVEVAKWLFEQIDRAQDVRTAMDNPNSTAPSRCAKDR
jgi:hypothetical protein